MSNLISKMKAKLFIRTGRGTGAKGDVPCARAHARTHARAKEGGGKRRGICAAALSREGPARDARTPVGGDVSANASRAGAREGALSARPGAAGSEAPS